MSRILYSILTVVVILTCNLSFAQEVDFSFTDNCKSIDERVEILVSQMTIEEKISQLTSASAAIPRLNVPDYHWWSEALHGVARNGEATVFPQALGMGATFDPELIKEVASAISTEARAKYTIAQQMGNHSKYAGLTFWSPTVNLFRDPRYGRGQECYGEDPFLMSKIGVAFVQGLQGDDPDHLKVAACAKHFALHSGPEHNKLQFNINPTPQDLHETYLFPFKALVMDGKVEGVMAAYNRVFGKPSCTNEYLLKELVREEWGFDGYVTSDCGAISGVAGKQGYAENVVEAASMALKAGTNLNCGGAYNQLKKALDRGLVTEKMIHENTKQLLKTRFRLGMFDKPGSGPYDNIGKEKIHCQEHIDLACEVAQKSIVLLKNKNNVLPLSKKTKVPYLTGPFANSNDILLGSYYGVTSNMVSILEGVASKLEQGTSLNYRTGALPFQINPAPKSWAPNVAKESDVIIYVVGTSRYLEGESIDAIASDHHGDKKDLKLPENQIKYFHQLVEKKGDAPLVLVIASGGPVSLEGMEEHCDAIMQIWYPGEQGGQAVADVLFGDVSPSGKLPVTFYKNVEQLPAYDQFSMQGRSYKYMTEDPMFPFGFGLTYSATEFSALKLNATTLKKKDNLTLSVDVENTGNYDIEEVVQLYICPKNSDDGVPLKSIKGFTRVDLVKGESKTLNFELSADELKFVNKNGELAWRKGEYTIVVGNASPGQHSFNLGAAKPQETTIVLK